MTGATPNLDQPFALAKPEWLFPLSVAQYEEMIAQGTLTTEDRVELLDGMLVLKMPQDNSHSSTIDRLTELWIHLLPKGWRTRIQLPIKLLKSMPEPDVAIIRGDRRSFDGRHPNPSDFGIIIEVADATLEMDRNGKRRLYAEAGIPEYWLVNLPERIITVYTHPQMDGTYSSAIDFKEINTIAVVLDGQTIGTLAVSDVLPTESLDQ